MKEHLSTFSPAEYFAALGLDQGESVDIVREIRKGFPVGVVSKLKDRLDVPRSTLLHVAAHGTYSVVPAEVRAQFDQAYIRPSYTRWAGHGRMELDLDGVTSEHEGEAIYEMIFSGNKYQINAE